MAPDAELAERIRRGLGDEESMEKRMFGGIGFMVSGNLAIAASGQGGLLVRIDPADAESLLSEPGASPMVMRGSEVGGWIRVEAAAVQEDSALERWIRVGVNRAGSLASQ